MNMAIYSRSTKKFFVNPYNFVSIKNGVDGPSGVIHDGKLLTGMLHCKLTVKTPLAIPDVEKKSEDESVPKHYHYPFFSVGDKYTIPGSSIRGAIRSMYEALTDSCFVTMPDEELLSLRVEPRRAREFKPGILIKEIVNGKEKWVLYKANRLLLPYSQQPRKNSNHKLFERELANGKVYYKGDDGQNLFYGDAVSVSKKGFIGSGNRKRTIVKEIKKDINKNNEYFIYVGEPIDGKWADSVFEFKKDNNNKKIEVKCNKASITNALNRLCETVKMYRDSAINRNLGEDIENHQGYSGFDNAKKNGCIPLWHRDNDSGTIYFSMAAIGRVIYNNTVNDLVGDKHTPCNNRKKLCPACRLFGMAKKEGRGSYVRITDAVISHKHSMTNLEEVTLKELGTPRTGYLPFYSINGNSYDEEGANIKGRKFYWHISGAEKSTISYKENNSKNKTERNATMELMPVGTEFEFDVFYNNITKSQYDELLWTLTLGNTNDEQCYYKLGHGKPLGLGSVHIEVISNKKRVYHDGEYKVNTEIGTEIQIETDTNCLNNFNSDMVEEIKKITAFHAMDEYEVRYPYVECEDDSEEGFEENDLANHQWFSNNKGKGKNAPQPQCIKNILEDEQKMAIYTAKKFSDNR